MSTIATRTLVLLPLVLTLSACVATTAKYQQATPPGTWTNIAEDTSNYFYFDPYRLYLGQDNTWVVQILAQNKSTAQFQSPGIWRVNCERLLYSENGPSLGAPGYAQSFKQIPAGSNVAYVARGLCGYRWDHDNQLYFFLTNVVGPPAVSIWLRGNEVTYKQDGSAELLAVYVNSSTGTSSPVKITINCSKKQFTEFDLTTGTQMGTSTVVPNSLRVNAIAYDRACNPTNSYMTRRHTDTKTSASKISRAEKLCAELGISPGTQPFRVCVNQLSRD